MITLIAIIILLVFLKVIGLIFGAGLRVLGWLISGLGFVFSIFFAVTFGLVFNILPILLIAGVLLIALKPL